jgi:hypothetical protein
MIAMANPEERFSQVNFTSIQFPSDEISIAQLRRQFPEHFDIGLEMPMKSQPIFFLSRAERDNAEELLGNMLYCERIVALDAYANAKGMKQPDCDIDEIKEDLNTFYCKFGLSQGEHQTVELIREIERQARQLVHDKPR